MLLFLYFPPSPWTLLLEVEHSRHVRALLLKITLVKLCRRHAQGDKYYVAGITPTIGVVYGNPNIKVWLALTLLMFLKNVMAVMINN